MSDDIFENGFFEDAGVNLNDIPDDVFDFGKDFWPIRIIEVGEPKVTKNADKVGMMVKWAVDHSKYQGHYVSQGLGNGHWIQLPVPVALQDRIPWDPKNNPEDKAVLVQLRDLFEALGFKNDEMGKVNGSVMLGRGVLAKIFPKKNNEGFMNFNLVGMKPLGDGSGADEFAQKPANQQGKTAAELMEEEMRNAEG